MESSHAPHDLIYLPKGSDYYVNNLHQEYTACINFQIQEPPDVPLSGEPFLLHCSNHSRMEQLYSEAVKAWRRQAPGRIYSCCAALNQILALAQTEIMRPYMISEQEKRMQSAIDYINDHFTSETISTGKLAELAGISEVYFRKMFRAKYGMSPLQYIKNRRIEYAKELILSSMCTIASAGELSGFTDASYFIREFGRATGLTPGEYRQTHT